MLGVARSLREVGRRPGWLDICHDEMIRERKKPVGLGGGRRIEKDEMGEIELS